MKPCLHTGKHTYRTYLAPLHIYQFKKKKETIYSKLVMMSERRRTKLSNTSKVVSESCILRIQTAMFKDHLINQRKIYCTSVRKG